MPIYEFRCRGCKEEFETLVRNTCADEPIVCPKCEGRDLERVLSICAKGIGQTRSAGCRPQATGFG